VERGLSAARTLPRFEVIAEALARTTLRLTRELASPSGAAPEWNDFEWAMARAGAAMNGISGLLANQLRWRGPDTWADFLSDQLDHSRRRDERIGALLESIDAELGRRDVFAIGLKGAALRPLGLYAAGERPMGDIDLLVGPDDVPMATAALEAAGYQSSFGVARHEVFAPVDESHAGAVHEFGEHAGNPIKVELHTRITESLPVDAIDITAALWPAAPHPGLNAYRTRSALLAHLLLHAAGSMRAHGLRVLQLQDIARLARGFDDCDWSLLFATAAGEPWWMLPPLTLAAECFPGSIPESVLREVGAHCPPNIRRLASRVSLVEVTWSNLRVSAFPGIGWARTPLETLSFVAARAFPRRAAREQLRQFVAASSALRSSVWYGGSHVSRILRWTFSSPPRAQTMSSVRAALESVRHP
jgi:hypothetical protein